MLKVRIINLMDKIFVSFCVFLIIYAWINFYIRSLWITFILSLIFTAALVFVMYYFLEKKQDKKSKAKHRTSLVEKYNIAFRLLSTNEKKDLLRQVFSVIHSTNVDQDLNYIIQGVSHSIIIATQYENLSQHDLLNLMESRHNDTIDQYIVICNHHTNINTKLLRNKVIKLITKDDLYTYFENTNIFPDISFIDENIYKLSWLDLRRKIFAKERARSYFFAGLILILSSIILPYQRYYRIMGSILLILALTCKLLPLIKHSRDRS